MFLALLTAFVLLKKKRRGNKQIKKTISGLVSQDNQLLQKEIIANRFNLKNYNKMNKPLSQESPSADGGDSVDAKESSKNVVAFNAGDENSCLEIGGKSLHIVGSAGSHDHGSSKVKLKNIVDYKWEMKHYPGHLIAVHMDGNHVAYVIVNNKANRMEGMVRVAKLSVGLRALIKGMSGEVLDIQFAHIEREQILASIDASSLFVHKIEMHEGALVCNLIIKVEDPIANYSPKFDKITWCPYVEQDEDDDDLEDNKLIVWARGSRFQCFNIKTIIKEHGKRKIQPAEINNGYMLFQDESLSITWVNLSPDGSTLGVGSTDGFIRFYQVYMFDKEWRCLHQWKPHNGKPISSFFFLDNLNKKNIADTYWKFAITCANNNTELKVWDCGTWDCIQTVTIGIKSENLNQTIRFIADIDRSAEYMVLTSLETRSCYVLEIDSTGNIQAENKALNTITENVTNNETSVNLPAVFIKSIAEFPLSSGVLSFSIMDAAVKRYKCGNDSYLCEELDDYDEENNSVVCVVVRIIIVQSKSLQECRILYQPTVTESNELETTLSGSVTSIAKDSTQNDQDDVVDSVPEDDKSKENIKKLNPLEVLLGIASGANSNSSTSVSNAQTTSQTSSNTLASTNPVDASPSGSDKKSESRDASPNESTGSTNVNATSKNYGQVNLMTPDSFTAKSTPDSVSSEVRNTILMIASATSKQQQSADNVNLMNLINNKLIEEQNNVQNSDPNDIQKKFIAIDRHPTNNVCDNVASGGSSPSREVQEIMSLHDYEKSSSSCDEEDLLDEQTTKTDDIKATADECDQDVSNKSTSTRSKVADVAILTTKHSAELQNAANLISQAVNASGGVKSNLPPSLGSNVSNSNSNIAVNGSAEIAEVNLKLNELIDLVKLQTVQINSLQNEISELKKVNSGVSNKSISEFAYKLEVQLSKLLEQYLKRYENEHNKRLTAFMSGRDVQNRELRDCFLQIVNQFVLTQMGEVVAKVINIEIQCHLSPMLTAKIDHLQQQIQIDIAQKLTSFDAMLKENISQACKNKTVIDAFGKSVLVGVQGSLQTAFIESMSSTLIPAYEKSSQNMFKQLHDAFSVGIKEFMEQFDTYMNHMRPLHDSSEEILNNFNGFRQHIDTILNNQRANINELMMEVRKDVKNLEVLLTRQVQEIVRAEIRKGFDHQTVALRSQANTPAPTYDLRDTIKLLLAQGQINKAFHQALLANDLCLVEFTLKNADHNIVFSPECVLEQKVLLSLMQQISADMSNHDEVKQSYLADTLLAINMNDPITREHAPKVLNELYRNCQMFLINFPKNSQCSNVRMLLKAVQSFNKDTF